MEDLAIQADAVIGGRVGRISVGAAGHGERRRNAGTILAGGNIYDAAWRRDRQGWVVELASCWRHHEARQNDGRWVGGDGLNLGNGQDWKKRQYRRNVLEHESSLSDIYSFFMHEFRSQFIYRLHRFWQAISTSNAIITPMMRYRACRRLISPLPIRQS
jgi:hypothetical protein